MKRARCIYSFNSDLWVRFFTPLVIAALSILPANGVESTSERDANRVKEKVDGGTLQARSKKDVANLGKAAFHQAFIRVLVSEKGEYRKHAITKAWIVPRKEDSGPLSQDTLEAEIVRTADVDRIRFKNTGTLTFSADGILSGQLRAGYKRVWDHGAYLLFRAVVFDQASVDVKADCVTVKQMLPRGRLHKNSDRSSDGLEDNELVDAPLFFYKEQAGEWEKLKAGKDRGGVIAHCAMRQWFKLLLLPVSHPFDPEENPLQAHCPAVCSATVNEEMDFCISVVGGLEPYEYKVGNLPPGLVWNEDKAIIEGTPQKTGDFNVTIEIKDAQFPTGAWEEAKSSRDTLGSPYQELNVALRINPPLTAELLLPAYSRKGASASAVCFSHGGQGDPVFHAAQLPPGIEIDTRTGRMHGIPEKIGKYPVTVLVQSQSGSKQIVAKGTWKIVQPLPEPRLK